MRAAFPDLKASPKRYPKALEWTATPNAAIPAEFTYLATTSSLQRNRHAEDEAESRESRPSFEVPNAPPAASEWSLDATKQQNKGKTDDVEEPQTPNGSGADLQTRSMSALMTQGFGHFLDSMAADKSHSFDNQAHFGTSKHSLSHHRCDHAQYAELKASRNTSYSS